MVTYDDPFMGVTSRQSLPQLSNKEQKSRKPTVRMVTYDDPFMGVTSRQSLPQLSNKEQKRLQNNGSNKGYT